MTDARFTLTVWIMLMLALVMIDKPPVIPQRPVDKPVAISAPVAARPFAARWSEAAVPAAIAAPAEPTIKMVRTISITKPVEPDPVVAPPSPPPPLPQPRPTATTDDDSEPEPPVRTRRTRTRMAALDICQRHNMRRVVTNGGRSWRCRR
jgi:hypothetical protein